MHRVRDFLPRLQLLGAPEAGHVGVAGGGGRDEGRFGDEQRAGDGGTLRVVVFYKGQGDVGVGGAEAG